jgi:hypothetical protein
MVIEVNLMFKAPVVLLPCSYLKQSFKEATMGITSCALCLFACLFVCLFVSRSTEHSKRGECFICSSQPEMSLVRLERRCRVWPEWRCLVLPEMTVDSGMD